MAKSWRRSKGERNDLSARASFTSSVCNKQSEHKQSRAEKTETTDHLRSEDRFPSEAEAQIEADFVQTVNVTVYNILLDVIFSLNTDLAANAKPISATKWFGSITQNHVVLTGKLFAQAECKPSLNQTTC